MRSEMMETVLRGFISSRSHRTMPISRRELITVGSAGIFALSGSRAAAAKASTGYTHHFRSKMVEISDTRLEVLEAGSGKTTFVCTHPYLDASGPFPAGGLTEALARAGRTFYVCPRGTAGSASESRPEKLTLSQLADDMEEVRERLGVEKWVPVGSSTGGMTALQSGIRYPNATKGLVLSCTAASYRFLEGPGTLYNPANPTYQRLARIREATRAGPEYERAQIEASLHNTKVLDLVMQNVKIQKERAKADFEEVATHKWDVEPFLSGIRAATLIIAGRFDAQAGSLEPSFTMLRAIDGSEYAIMNSSGHFPFDEEPERYQQVIADFTKRRFDTL